jgi:hypothetical protein
MHVRFLPKQHERKLQRMRTNVLKDTPTIVTKTRFAKTPEGSYTCTCKDGYSDLDPDAKAGTICAQINECIHPSMNNCNSETQVCLDYPPPKKWECIERTPAPTPFPTLSPKEFNCRSNGFTSVALCIACSFLKLRSARDCESTSRVGLDSTPKFWQEPFRPRLDY